MNMTMTAWARRLSERQSGEAFDRPAFYLYDYNNRDEITSTAAFDGSDPNDQTRPMPEQTRFYQYDAIGNRQKILEGAEQSGYSLNSLNQYTQVSGDTPAVMTYDANGNLTTINNDTTDSRYSYNAENRLVGYEPIKPRKNDTRVTFTYDYMGRRAEKKTFTFSNNNWKPAKHTYFIYDGWNLLAEIDLNAKKETNYVWGLDRGGSLHGPAGGVGGLLARIDKGQQVTHYTYDNRGNASQLISSDGTIISTYQYDPYGNLLPGSSPNVDPNPFRFSTKYHDSDLNLYNYGYRHYSPTTGRWLTRDPIGELGGKNLYTFANNSINNIDSNGLYVYDIHYIAVFATLIAAGQSTQDAWEIAYYSSYPDMDKRYDAISNAIPAFFGSEDGIKYQEYLHSLNGKSLDEIEILRKCTTCLIKNDQESTMSITMNDHQVDGILLHLLGDTYGHLELEYIWENDEIVDYGAGDKTYSGGLGHLFDITFPDMVAYRPELANEFLWSVFQLFGAEYSLDMNIIKASIKNLALPKFPTANSVFDIMHQELLLRNKFGDDLSPDFLNFNPNTNDVLDSSVKEKFGVKEIQPSEMGNLLDIVIRCSEGKK